MAGALGDLARDYAILAMSRGIVAGYQVSKLNSLRGPCFTGDNDRENDSRLCHLGNVASLGDINLRLCHFGNVARHSRP